MLRAWPDAAAATEDADLGCRRVAARDPLRAQGAGGVAFQGRLRVPSDVVLRGSFRRSAGWVLRPGNATANSGADQLAVVDLAIDQLPDAYQAERNCEFSITARVNAALDTAIADTAMSRTGSRTSKTLASNGCRSPASTRTRRGWR